MNNYTKYQKNEDLKFPIIILLVLLATSGFPSFLGFKAVVVPILLPILYYKIIKANLFINKKIFFVIFILILFAALHLINDLTIIGALSFVLSMTTIAFSSIVIGKSFIEAFVKIMIIFASIAIVIWVLLLLIPSLHSILLTIGTILPQMFTEAWLQNTTNNGVSFYLYFLPQEITSWGVIRNCGPFFEPGLFASYLNIALILNISRNRNFISFCNLILIIAILTTLSSAGYITLVLIVLYSMAFSKSYMTKFVAIIIAALLFQPMMQLDFMSEKIKLNFEDANESSTSRFGALIYHMEKIIESPFIGYAGGELPRTDFDKQMGVSNMDMVISPNGLSYPFVYWGIPFAILFYVFLYLGLKKLVPDSVRQYELILIYIIILSTAFSQTITTEPIILLIAALSFTDFSKRANKLERQITPTSNKINDLP